MNLLLISILVFVYLKFTSEEPEIMKSGTFRTIFEHEYRKWFEYFNYRHNELQFGCWKETNVPRINVIIFVRCL